MSGLQKNHVVENYCLVVILNYGVTDCNLMALSSY